MVAPTRTPQARGVKCDLCKKILATATWLDQTKLAKCVEDAQLVLQLLEQHGKTECPCIPKSIENLLVGSTHFEVHRLTAKQMDTQVHRRQAEESSQTRQKISQERLRNQFDSINDCNETPKISRFKTERYQDKRHYNMAVLQLDHLIQAINFWNIAMYDQTNPFNSKLALRLGLTHHVIYACYLFKYCKMLDHQLISAKLLLNLFASIEGVTENAALHASYLLVRAFMDCKQYSLAKQRLSEASKMPNYEDKSYYESILLTCASCELNLLDNKNNYGDLDTLAELAIIKPDDKLQHYYARTLAISIIIKYIHCYPARSDLCFEFYHTFRYTCAIIRRCYESSFELVLSQKESKQNLKPASGSHKAEILDHSWIRYAACDFVFATFDFLFRFYMRAGQPESLELLYNGLNLVVYRNGSFYWQTRMAVIGANLDVLCDKFDSAEAKLEVAKSHIISQASAYLISGLLDLEISLLSLVILWHKKKITHDIASEIQSSRCSLEERISKSEMFDCNCLTIVRTIIWLMLKTGNVQDAKKLVADVGSWLDNVTSKIIDYNHNHEILEIMLFFVEIENSGQLLLKTVSSSNLFLNFTRNMQNVENQLSVLTISGQTGSSSSPSKRKASRGKSRKAKLSLGRAGRRKGIYDVASASEENLASNNSCRYHDTIDMIKNFSSVTNEDIVVTYLKNSEPNPCYLLYRQAHELMLCYRLKDGCRNYDQLLYHFSESSTSNTIRYRWMMFEEQHATQGSFQTNQVLRHLSFKNTLVEPDKTQKFLLKAIPDDFKVVQFKYIIDTKAQEEHLLIATSDKLHNSAIFAHVERQLISDDFFEDAHTETEALSIPSKFGIKIEEAKKTLFQMNQCSRSEARKRIEEDIGSLLGNFENEWLGPSRFLLSGKINDASYIEFVHKMVEEFQKIMVKHKCISIVALKAFVENAPILGREGFRTLISALFNCATTCSEERDCFNRWMKSMETFVDNQKPGLSKVDFLHTLARGQVGLILDKHLEMIPIESLPMMREIKQGMFRVPSVRLLHIIVCKSSYSLVANPDETAYILDPANNLSKTRERFENKLKLHKSWEGAIGEPPNSDTLEKWLLTKQLYLFIGHGAGTVYYNKLCKGRGLSAMTSIKPISIVMGCSSGRVLSEGSKLESFGVSWIFIFRGSPCYVGLLWDVTDTDIDNFLDSLLENWLSQWENLDDKTESHYLPITNAVCKAKLVCKFKFLVGSTPVVYGLPVCSK